MSDILYDPRPIGEEEDDFDDAELDPSLLDNYEAMNEGRDRPLDLRERMVENEEPGSLEAEEVAEQRNELDVDEKN